MKQMKTCATPFAMKRTMLFVFSAIILAFLSCRTYPELPNKARSPRLFVIVDQLAVRGFPGPGAAVITYLREGSEVRPTGRLSANTNRIELRGQPFDEQWIEVQLADGRSGWIFGGGLSSSYPPSEDTFPEHFGLNQNGKLVIYSVRRETAVRTEIPVRRPLPDFSSYDVMSGLALLTDMDYDTRRRSIHYLDRNGHVRIHFEDPIDRRISSQIGFEYIYTPFREGFAFIGLQGDYTASMDDYLAENRMRSRFIDSEGRTYLEFKGAWRSGGFYNGVAILVKNAGVDANNHILIVHRNGRVIDLPGVWPAFDNWVNGYDYRNLYFQEGLFPIQSGTKGCGVYSATKCEGVRYIDSEGRDVVRAPPGAVAGRHFHENFAVVTVPDTSPGNQFREKHILLERFGGIRSGEYFYSSDVEDGHITACTEMIVEPTLGSWVCKWGSFFRFSVHMEKKDHMKDGKLDCSQNLYLWSAGGMEPLFGYRSCSTGKLVIPAQFSSANPFVNGYAQVMLRGGQWALIDMTGRIRWQTEK